MATKNIVLKKGDITDSVVNAIVNAGNTWLKLGSGVSGAINQKGGPRIQQELDGIREGLENKRLVQGEVVVTSAGNLRCRYIIHPAVVGPEQVNEDSLRTAIRNCLRQANALKCQSLAFPALGTGVGRFPITECALVMVDEVILYLQGEVSLRGVMFVLFKEEDQEAFEDVLKTRDVQYRKI